MTQNKTENTHKSPLLKIKRKISQPPSPFSKRKKSWASRAQIASPHWLRRILIKKSPLMSRALLNGLCSVPMSKSLLEERLMTMLFALKTRGNFFHFLKLKEPFSVKQCHPCPLCGNDGQHPHKTLQILV
jgi:hypothetical protein